MNDTRLQKRAVKIAQDCAERPEKTLSGRFDNWAGLKAAYRFFSNRRFKSEVRQLRVVY